MRKHRIVLKGLGALCVAALVAASAAAGTNVLYQGREYYNNPFGFSQPAGGEACFAEECPVLLQLLRCARPRHAGRFEVLVRPTACGRPARAVYRFFLRRFCLVRYHQRPDWK